MLAPKLCATEVGIGSRRRLELVRELVWRALGVGSLFIDIQSGKSLVAGLDFGWRRVLKFFEVLCWSEFRVGHGSRAQASGEIILELPRFSMGPLWGLSIARMEGQQVNVF